MSKKKSKPPTAEEIAEMMGVAPEKTFKVDHEGMGKAGKGIDMKVGGIGIQFMDKKGRDVQGESFLYVNVVGWKFSRADEKLHIEVGKTGGPIEREVVIITAEGEEIGLLMRDHAKSVAKQLKSEKAEAKKAEADKLRDAVGKYRIENPVTLRAGVELNTEQTASLEAGAIIEVDKAEVNTVDTVRLHCEEGWLSLKPHLVVKLDDEGNPIVEKKIDVTGYSGDSVPLVAGSEAEDLAAEIGMLADATFDVKQRHIKKTPQGKKCPEQVQLKVGGMGVNVFDGQMPVENHLYFAMKGWTYSKRDKSFDIQLKSGSKITFITEQGEEIATNMNQHATSLSEAKAEALAAEAEAEAEADAEEGVPPEETDGDYDPAITDDSEGDILLGYWRVQNLILVRAGVEVSSEEAGKLEPNDVIKVTEVSKNSTGTVRLCCAVGWASFKPHLVKKLKPGYEPSADFEKIQDTLTRALTMYRLLDDTQQLEVEGSLVSKWSDIFGGADAGAASPAADKRLANAQKLADESAERVEELEKESAEKSAKIEELQAAASAAAAAEGGQAAELSGNLDTANAQIETLKQELADAVQKTEQAEAAAADAAKNDDAEELAALRASAEKAEDERAMLIGKAEKAEAQQKKLQLENKKLQEELAAANKGGGAAAADEDTSLPPAVQEIFDKANNADAAKDKKTALQLYQTGVKQAMAHMKTHPATKKHLTPILQQVMKRAQELKAEIAAAKAAPPAAAAADAGDSEDPEDPLPADIRAMINQAKEADTPGNEAAAISLFEASAKKAMTFLRANPAKKAELTPTLQQLIMRTRALKAELKSAE